MQVINVLSGLGATMVPLPGNPTGLPGLPLGGSVPATGPLAGQPTGWLNYTIPGGSKLVSG